MRLSVRFYPCIVATFAFALLAGAGANAQSSGGSSSSSNSGSNSGSNSASAPSTTGETAAELAANGAYIPVDPLANVRYNNRWDVSLEMAYQHIKAGPNVLQGANLGGLNLSGSYWLTKRWGVEGSGRGFLGTSGVGQPNALNIKGPFISEYFFTAGPEWLGPHNKHGALIAHVLVGGVYGDFEGGLQGQNASYVAFYNDQVAPAVIMGGHFDLNRSAHWVFRVTTDATMTHYSTNYGAKIAQWDINPAVSVGVQYKFTKIKR
ncbi:MAG TPA: hypothetical protein VHX20_08065 [Terracidiphilus sp.]|jgi:hypothetical protein|nr:hypothetical protein [Terracidiphilus sp.]